MENSKIKRLSEIRASFGIFSQNEDSDEIDDPVSAYFKQRSGNPRQKSIEIHAECDSDSSLGLIDVDNVSLFGEEENKNKNLRLSELDQLTEKILGTNGNSRESKDLKIEVSGVQSELDKQRALAQLALRRLSSRSNKSHLEMTVTSPEKKESKVLSDISSKLMNMKLSLEEGGKQWFEPNFSPNTPRYFNDELNSFGGEDENLPDVSEVKEETKKRQSEYAKKVNSLLKDFNQIPLTSDITFESLSAEEQINRFEEDEKKFKLENSGLLHNSQISQFSGTAGENLSQWLQDISGSKAETDKKNLSIGQFFNIRSNRISSLVGSTAGDNSILSVEQLETSILTDAQTQHLSKSECSFPVNEIPQEKPKFRRCVSTYDLYHFPETAKSMRYSSDSCSSNSTIMIQDILAEMESGLSGTQIYEKLMKSFGKKKEKENKKCGDTEKIKKISENKETPKSSKTVKLKDVIKNNKKELSFNDSAKTSQSHISLVSIHKEAKEERDLRFNETIPSGRSEKIKKNKISKGFYASTPKNQGVKSQKDKLKTACNKVLISKNDWEPPRVASILSADLSRSMGSDENEKTITVNSSSTSSGASKKNNTIVIHDTFSIEDTITAGDLTVLSQRIEEMKRDSVCIVRSAESEEPVLLTVIQKLADLPKGSLDCSALTPLLRDQFPELLSNFPTPRNSSVHVSLKSSVQDALITLPDSWIKMAAVWGLKQKIYACADLQKTVLIPIENISQNWLLISLESLELVHPQGKKLMGVKKNNEWCVLDFVAVFLKETIIPPDNRQSLKVLFKSSVATKLELMLTFGVKELIKGEVQTRSLRLLISSVHPEHYINVFPTDAINFGVIADQCYDQKNIQISFDGICELPLTVFIEEDESSSGQFALNTGCQYEKKSVETTYHHLFYEGEKQVLEFRISFSPNITLKEDSKTQDFRAQLVLMLDSKTDTDGILKKIPIKGSVGFAKFLGSSSSNPLVFRASEKGQLVTRSYPMKNIGLLPIAFSVNLEDEDGESLDEDDVFIAPESFYLSRNEESEINITFNARGNQHFVKRYLKLKIKPNGRIIYGVELIGIITSLKSKHFSRTSAASVSTKSTASTETGAVKLMTTSASLSWAAVSLDKESRQTFQIKSLSAVSVSVRISFEKNLDSFKLVNENGEKVHKLRKILKPDCPCALTVVFRPDVVGAHNNCLKLETSHSECKNRVPLNGIGGIPNLVMRNVKSDLNGCKILRLQHSRNSNQFENVIEFTNEGRIPAFLLIKTGVKDFSLNHELSITPSSIVISPDSTVSVIISQKLRNSDFQQLLSNREIRKIATICVLTGDEPSRLRMKKLVNTEKLHTSERLKIFTEPYQNEKEMQLEIFSDSLGFENEFLKSLKAHEIAVVIEKNAEFCETTILDESSDEFVSFISYKTVITPGQSRQSLVTESCSGQQKSTYSNPVEINATLFSVDSLKSAGSRNRITKWLETLDS